jgi:hypothetical protein
MRIVPITPVWLVLKGCDLNVKLKKQPTEYLKQIYFDSLIFSPEAIRHLVAQVGAGQVVLGSDYPYPWQMQPVDPHRLATRRRPISSAAPRQNC